MVAALETLSKAVKERPAAAPAPKPRSDSAAAAALRNTNTALQRLARKRAGEALTRW